MIAHIDMDAFFARCEELRNPKLEDKPVVICVYTRGESSGAVSTSNYMARELGIDSGMPLAEARSKANNETVFLPVDHDYYSEKSKEVFSEVRSFSKKVQKTSIDEAYFRLEGDVEKKARMIKSRIRSRGLTASIGIAPNKFMAKMASEEDKPDGLTIVKQEKAEEFLRGKSVEKIHGVGPKTASKLKDMGIEKIEDLREANTAFLADKLGRSKAKSLAEKAIGKGSTDLEPGSQKQLSKIKTMERNSSQKRYIMRELEEVSKMLETRIKTNNLAFRSVTLIAIDTDLNTYTRSTKVGTAKDSDIVLKEAEKLVERLLSEKDSTFRRIGLRVSDLVDASKQASLKKF